MATETKRNTTRVQIELPEASFERLNRLKEKTEASSYAEVLKNALRLYEALVLEAEAGNEISIKEKSGVRVTYRAIF
jgi:metal-responsive CopG/Arc/MetJ family transcriptional regulator